MLGIVLCGGQSTRMGTDKGLLKLEANTWAQTAVDKIASLNVPVKISVNATQYSPYAAVFPEADIIPDNPSLQLKGPLEGTLSCHLAYPDEDLFILACDMPLMESILLKELYSISLRDPAAEVYIYTTDGEAEPLCAIYRAKGLSTIMNMLHQGQLVKHSMKFMLEHLSIHSIEVPGDQKKCFRNFNAHAELNGL